MGFPNLDNGFCFSAKENGFKKVVYKNQKQVFSFSEIKNPKTTVIPSNLLIINYQHNQYIQERRYSTCESDSASPMQKLETAA